MEGNDKTCFVIQPACLCPNSSATRDDRQMRMTDKDTPHNAADEEDKLKASPAAEKKGGSEDSIAQMNASLAKVWSSQFVVSHAVAEAEKLCVGVCWCVLFSVCVLCVGVVVCWCVCVVGVCVVVCGVCVVCGVWCVWCVLCVLRVMYVLCVVCVCV